MLFSRTFPVPKQRGKLKHPLMSRTTLPFIETVKDLGGVPCFDTSTGGPRVNLDEITSWVLEPSKISLTPSGKSSGDKTREEIMPATILSTTMGDVLLRWRERKGW